MANYSAAARSNYFKVKARAAFLEAIRPFDIQLADGPNGLCLLSNAESGWDWYNPRTDEPILPEELIGPHLQDGEVCILMEAGAEKLRYISGYAEAFDNTGKRITICLQDIYPMARKEFGENASITEATY